MRDLKEARHHGDLGLPVGCYVVGPPYAAPYPQLECHWHEEMELFRPERGPVRVQCGSQCFQAQAGELVFFNAGELHAAQPLEGGPMEFTAVVFSPKMLWGDENDIVRRKYVAPVLEGNLRLRRVTGRGSPQGERILQAFAQTAGLLQNRPGAYELRVRACLLEIFASLAEQGERAAPPREQAPAQGMKAALDHIQGNFQRHITVEELAALSHMSVGHFCRLFKKYTLKTPVQFINAVRLSAAADLLQNSQRKELDIALETGFNSLNYFIEVFKQGMGCTPMEYRRRMARQAGENGGIAI